MLYTRIDEHVVHRGTFHSLRMQLLFIACFSVILPALIMVALRGPDIVDEPTVQITLGISFAAGISALLALRRVGSFFGALMWRWVLPTYSGSVALFSIPVILFRLPYSTVLLTLCLMASFVSLYVLVALMVRGRKATCYIVPVGRAIDFEFNWGLRVKLLGTASLPDDPRAVFVADLHANIGTEWEHLLTEAALKGYPVYHYTQLREAMTGKVQFEHLSENSFGSMARTVPYTRLKRLFDLAGCVCVLPFLLPLLAVVAIAIKVDSDGPAIFRQRRMGYRGHFFIINKFRTMSVMEDGTNHKASITADSDQRITRLGGFLRRTRIDELPQIWNIILGDMSWIGPRPEAVSLSAAYEAELPYYRYRHMVRPGITGWAQVHQGHVTSVDDVNDKLQYDFYYVRNISFWLDFVIALRTVRVIMSGFGAK